MATESRMAISEAGKLHGLVASNCNEEMRATVGRIKERNDLQTLFAPQLERFSRECVAQQGTS